MEEIHTLPFAGCQEPVSSLSHLLGAFYFAWLGMEMIRRGRGDRTKTISVAIMTITSVVLLLLSSAYHVSFPGAMRNFMLRADVSAVFLVIAGSMTPVHAILFRGRSRWLALTVIWTTAMLGMIIRMVFHESMGGRPGVMLFLVFGWGGAITFTVLWRKFGWRFVQPAFLSGMFYTSGALMLFFHSPTLVQNVIGPHELWHFTVLAGLGLHWHFVSQFAYGNLNWNFQPASDQQSQRSPEAGELQTT